MVMDPSDRTAWDAAHRREGEPALPQRVRDRLPPLGGLRILHLQAGDGAETLELAAAGGLVTGVDSSPEALELARRNAPELPWVQAEPHELPGELRRGRFDLVFCSLARVGALEPWAAGVFAALRPLGWLVVHDVHPAAACLDAALHWREDYFAGRTLGAIVTAVSQAGLSVRRLEEYPARGDAWRRQDPRVPAEFLLRAEKPQ
jgi:SAM-dependent methyltransferase